jgi:hypothetical protein
MAARRLTADLRRSAAIQNLETVARLERLRRGA